MPPSVTLRDFVVTMSQFYYSNRFTENVKLRDCPLVIDGCDLMEFLYFRNQNAPAVNENKGKKTGSLGKKGVPNSHWFGGDWKTYAFNVRSFFQQLKECGIIPIVVMDGTYSYEKAMNYNEVMAREIEKNVKFDGFPGNTYKPVFLKTVFLEVLVEQNILRYQTLGSAINTIALVARLMGDCYILSSKEDYVLYINNKALLLHSVKFSKTEKKSSDGNSNAGGNQKGVYSLEAGYLAIHRLCDEEYELKDRRLFTLAAVVLGNDYVRRQAFVYWEDLRSESASCTAHEGIARLMIWLIGKESLEEGIEGIMSLLPDDKEQAIKDTWNLSINEIINMYEGKRGEDVVWFALKTKLDVSKWMNEEALALEALSRMTLTVTATGDTPNEPPTSAEFVQHLDKLLVDGLPTMSNLETDHYHRVVEYLNESEDQQERERQIAEKENFKQQISMLEIKDCYQDLPNWFIRAYLTCELQADLLGVFQNNVVSFNPQVEWFDAESCHELSLSIIQVTCGILNSGSASVFVASRKAMAVSEREVNPTTSLQFIGGDFPRIMLNTSQGDFTTNTSFWKDLNKKVHDINREYLRIPKLKKLAVIEQVLFGDNFEMRKYVLRWPESYRIWVACLLHYVSKKFESEGRMWKEVISTACAIFFCIFKNLLLKPIELTPNQGSSTTNVDNPNYSHYAQAVKGSPDKRNIIRDFYQKREDYSKVTEDEFKQSYNIKVSHALSEYQCVLFHTQMLNSLLNKPYMPPSIRCTLNNFLMYQMAAEFMNLFLSPEISISMFMESIVAACGIDEVRPMADEFVCLFG